MYLYANGCSMTYGMELVDDPVTGECLDHDARERSAWPGRLGEFFGADTVVNAAVISGSNARVVRTTVEWLCAHRDLVEREPGLVVIGWSGAMRREFYVDGAYRQVIPYQTHTPEALERLVEVYRDVAWDPADDADRLLTDVLTLQTFLEHEGVPYVFFDAVDEAWDTLGRGGRTGEARLGRIRAERYVGFGEPATSMSKRLRATTLPWAGKHPSVEGHEFWASELAAFVMSRDLLKPVRTASRVVVPDSGSQQSAGRPEPASGWARPDDSFIYP